MAIAGPKPKDDARKINRNPPTHDWIEVEDVPFKGNRPKARPEWPADSKRWWHAISTMPHCALWAAPDWEYALMTARLHVAAVNGDLGKAPELRIREKAMGTTAEALRDLRIRYVMPDGNPAGIGSTLVPPTDFDAARRRRLLDAE